DAETGSVREFDTPKADAEFVSNFHFTGLRYAQDGRRLAAIDSFREFWTWPADNLAKPALLKLGDDSFFSDSEQPITIASDLTRVAWAFGNRITVWSPQTGKALMR